MEKNDISVFAISKSSGSHRLIYAPSRDLKRRLRALVPQLNLIAEKLDTHRCQHGFTECRSPLTNARVHIGWRYSVTMDIADFFPHVTRALVEKSASGCALPNLDECFIDGAAQQGLPTSPALANIAVAPMCDEIWLKFCRKGRFTEAPAAFTIYADDLTISCNTQSTVDLALLEIPAIVRSHGFDLNKAKTRVQCSVAGMRVITGVSVNETGCHITREVRRRIRAGHHQDQYGLRKRNIRRMLFGKRKWKKHLPLRLRFYWQLKGLVEWSRLKTPKEEQKVAKNAVVRAAARVVATVCGQNVSNRITNAWARRFG